MLQKVFNHNFRDSMFATPQTTLVDVALPRFICVYYVSRKGYSKVLVLIVVKCYVSRTCMFLQMLWQIPHRKSSIPVARRHLLISVSSGCWTFSHTTAVAPVKDKKHRVISCSFIYVGIRQYGRKEHENEPPTPHHTHTSRHVHLYFTFATDIS